MLPQFATSLVLAAALVGAESGDRNADLLSAAKKGDAEAVKSLLARGADVNARNSYGATALAFAADKGHLAVVKLLLEHKADVNSRDTFYKETPLGWAVGQYRVEIVKALLESGATGADLALQRAAIQGQTELVRVLLDKGKLQQDVLDKALLATPAKHAAVALLLKKAGAKSVPVTEVTVDRDILASYAGTYRNERDMEIIIASKDSKLTFQFGTGAAVKLIAIDKASFESADRMTSIGFRREASKVSGMSVKSTASDVLYKRVESASDVAAPTETIDDRGGVVKAPLNWPSFRGPQATGVADGQYPPLTWNAEKKRNIRWKTPIPGLGLSSPVVWEDRIYVTTAVSADGKAEFRPGAYGDVESVKESAEQSWRVYCLDKREGKVLWERTACRGKPKVKRHPKASHANPTPATDGMHIVVSFGSEGLYCYDRDGKLLWQKNLGVLDSGWFYDADYQWGFASSPLLYKGLAIVQCDVGKDSFIAAYQVGSGKEVWRKSRDEISSWGTPAIVEGPKRIELVTGASKYARGYDPLTGAELWRLGPHGEITVPTPIFGAGLIFITNGYRPVQPIYAIRPGAIGDISLKDGKTASDAIAWSTTRGGPYMPTPIVYAKYLYICSNSGLVTCREAQTGKEVYKERLGGSGTYTASPVAADGKIYFTSEENGIRVVRAGPRFGVLAVNPLGDPCLATPAISDGMIFFGPNITYSGSADNSSRELTAR